MERTDFRREDLAVGSQMSESGTSGMAGAMPRTQTFDAGSVAGQSQSTAEQLKEQAREAAARVSSGAKDLGQQAKAQAGDVARSLKERGQTMFSERKNWAAEELSHFNSAARQAAAKLREEDDHNVAEYAEAMADQLDGVVNYLRDRDLNSLLSDTEDLARQRPALFFGGLFVVGLAAARFLKASRKPRSQDTPWQTEPLRSPATTGYLSNTPAAPRPGTGLGIETGWGASPAPAITTPELENQ